MNKMIQYALSISTVIALFGCSSISELSYQIKMNNIESGQYFRERAHYSISEDDYLEAYESLAKEGYAPAIEKVNEIKAKKEVRAKDRAEKERKDAEAAENYKKQVAAEQAARMAAIEERNKATRRDEKRGYRYMTLQDFKLDAKGMHESSKVVLTGYYTLLGKIERISDYPTKEDFGNRVAIITSNADRGGCK